MLLNPTNHKKAGGKKSCNENLLKIKRRNLQIDRRNRTKQ
jgi:hypothetical protein